VLRFQELWAVEVSKGNLEDEPILGFGRGCQPFDDQRARFRDMLLGEQKQCLDVGSAGIGTFSAIRIVRCCAGRPGDFQQGGTGVGAGMFGESAEHP